MIPVHIAKSDKGSYFLKEVGPLHFEWFFQDTPTGIKSTNPREAIRLAFREFRLDHFDLLFCGNKFSLPERDEHGEAAYFSDLVKSLATTNGQYFDPLLGQNYIVKEIPTHSRDLALSYLQG